MKIPVSFTVATCFCLSIICAIAVSVQAIAPKPNLSSPIHRQPIKPRQPKSFHWHGSCRGQVLVNGQAIVRSTAGHFAPSFPLQIGVNQFTFRYGTQELKRTVTRETNGVTLPIGNTFAKESLTPVANIGRLPDELICFGAIAHLVLLLEFV